MLTNIILQAENRSKKNLVRVALSDRKGWSETISELTASNFKIRKDSKFSFFVVDCLTEGLTKYEPIQRRHARIDYAKSFYDDLCRFGLLNASDPQFTRRLEMFSAAAQYMSIEAFLASASPSDWTAKIDYAKMSLPDYAGLLGVTSEELEKEGYRSVLVDGRTCVCRVWP